MRTIRTPLTALAAAALLAAVGAFAQGTTTATPANGGTPQIGAQGPGVDAPSDTHTVITGRVRGYGSDVTTAQEPNRGSRFAKPATTSSTTPATAATTTTGSATDATTTTTTTATAAAPAPTTVAQASPPPRADRN